MNNLINDIIQKNKPKNVYKIILKIEFVDDRYGYRINPQYILERDSKLMDIVWIDKKKKSWTTLAEKVLTNFEEDMCLFLGRYVNTKIYFSGRGIMEKEYWLKNYSNNINPF